MTQEIYDNIIQNTAQYLNKNKINTVVLGLSGGIDSTTVAFLCDRIRKTTKKNLKLIGVSLPSNTNEDKEKEIADLLGWFVCDEYKKKPIQEIYESYLHLMTDNNQTPLANGNIKARLRMIYLYNLAGINHGLVLSTGNKTEDLLGFFTVHGDEGDLAPIGELYKTDVYDLAWYILETEQNEDKKKCLLKAIEITPTDGNGVVDGGDLKQILPRCENPNYEIVDNVLRKLNENEHYEYYEATLNELSEIYGKDNVEDISTRYLKNEYKRKPRPYNIQIK